MLLCPLSDDIYRKFDNKIVNRDGYDACNNIASFMARGSPEQKDKFLKEWGSQLSSKIAGLHEQRACGDKNLCPVADSVVVVATGGFVPWLHTYEAKPARDYYNYYSTNAIRLLDEPEAVYDEHFG